jgi:Protein of unknown function (DUF2442)
MTINPRVIEVSPHNNYTLTLHFSNGEVGVYDCKYLLDFGVFVELKDLAYFKRVKPFNGTVVWPHEQDIDPDTLYLDSVKEVSAVS